MLKLCPSRYNDIEMTYVDAYQPDVHQPILIFMSLKELSIYTNNLREYKNSYNEPICFSNDIPNKFYKVLDDIDGKSLIEYSKADPFRNKNRFHITKKCLKELVLDFTQTMIILRNVVVEVCFQNGPINTIFTHPYITRIIY